MKEFLMENGTFIIWGLIAVASLIVEAITTEMVSCWFAPGAIVAMVMSGYRVPLWGQILTFLVISAVLLLLARLWFKKHPIKVKGEDLNADSLIGETGIVQEEINNLSEKGSVRIRSLIWTARSEKDETVIPTGTLVRIREIHGVKLICEPAETKETENKKGE